METTDKNSSKHYSTGATCFSDSGGPEKRVSLERAFSFEASHQLHGYPGKCARLHGHSYSGVIEVSRALSKADACGIVLDFGVLKQAAEDCIEGPYDHQHLNMFFERPTAELMVETMGRNLKQWFASRPEYADVRVERVYLRETAKCSATYRPA